MDSVARLNNKWTVHIFKSCASGEDLQPAEIRNFIDPLLLIMPNAKSMANLAEYLDTVIGSLFVYFLLS